MTATRLDFIIEAGATWEEVLTWLTGDPSAAVNRYRVDSQGERLELLDTIRNGSLEVNLLKLNQLYSEPLTLVDNSNTFLGPHLSLRIDELLAEYIET